RIISSCCINSLAVPGVRKLRRTKRGVGSAGSYCTHSQYKGSYAVTTSSIFKGRIISSCCIDGLAVPGVRKLRRTKRGVGSAGSYCTHSQYKGSYAVTTSGIFKCHIRGSRAVDGLAVPGVRKLRRTKRGVGSAGSYCTHSQYKGSYAVTASGIF